jgi:cytochrome c5
VKKSIILFIFLGTLIACGGNSSNEKKDSAVKVEKPKTTDGKGIGEIKSVALNNPLNQEMITKGEGIYNMKCAACHKLGTNRVVGPGFKGVTDRRKPEWIMNMITNTEAMLDEDPEARKLFEECLTRMPNQNVALADARDILEFLLKNDQ